MAKSQVSDARGTVPTEYQEMSDRYVGMSTDALLRVAADPKSLTTTAREALAEELQKRGLDSPDAVAKYEGERDRQIKQEEEHAAAVRWSKRSRFQGAPGGRFSGSGLHIPVNGGSYNPSGDPNSPFGFNAQQYGSYFTAHIDSANPFDDLVSFFSHLVNNVILRRPHGC